MSLQEKVLEAAGGARWTELRHFIGHLSMSGSLVEPLAPAHGLREIVAEGDLATRSIRISGFSNRGRSWGFSPEFITIQRDNGGFTGARRKAAPRPFQKDPKDEAELVYLCGLSIWNCMTAPPSLMGPGAEIVDRGAWTAQGEAGQRLQVTAPEGALAYAREVMMYFGDDGLIRRTDFDVVCGHLLELTDYASAHQAFSGLTIPTLHRIVNRAPPDGPPPPPVLDIEVFDATFD